MKLIATEVIDYYVTNNHTLQETASHFSTTECFLEKYLRKNNIKKRFVSCKQKEVDYKDLYEYYIEQNHTEEETALKFNMSERTLRRKLAKYNIKKGIPLQVEASKRKQREKFGDLFVRSDYYRTHVKAQMCHKMKQTCLQRYGVEYVTQTEEHKKQVEQTCYEHYGVRFYTQTKEYHKNACHKYKYDGVSFDSSWELSLWIYAIEHHEPIERCPCKFKYQYNNRTHWYFPDFRYRGQIIEIKGNHLFNKSGELTVIFKGEQSDFLKAKTQCLQDNHVVIWGAEQIQFALDYVKNKYGSQYINLFKEKQ